MVVCKACNTDNPPGATYCVTCARKLDPETQDAVVRQRAAHTATGINWSSVLIAALVTVIVLALIVFLVVHGL